MIECSSLPGLTDVCCSNPRDWHVPLSAAIDAYRSILTKIRQLEFDKLQLDALGQLATNCPRCFGPPAGVTNPNEPDVVVCLDGNFQHQQHAAASVPIPGYNPPVPELFVPPKELQDMVDELTRIASANSQDINGHKVVSVKCDWYPNPLIPKLVFFFSQHPCTESHTAADDIQGKNHF